MCRGEQVALHTWPKPASLHAPTASSLRPRRSQLIESGDALGCLLRPQDARPEFEAWIKGGLAAVGLELDEAALERSRRDTSAAKAGGGGSGGGAGGAGGAAGAGVEIAAAAVARVVAQGSGAAPAEAR